jgi:hypothetical protein
VDRILRAAHVVAEEIATKQREGAIHSLLRISPPPEEHA